MMHIVSNRDFEIASAGCDHYAVGEFGLYAQAASLVPMGAWSCELATSDLEWTAGVFEMFGFPHGAAPDRQDTVDCYDEPSRVALETSRARAIATGSGFSLDAKITRLCGAERWIRVTAATRRSNGRAVALYGMKQDVTEDYARWDRLRAQAECDPLTGIANRAPFQRFLEQPNRAGDGIGALLLIDMDRFKHINDVWGHLAGDACLVRFAGRLKRAFPEARLVSRIGGDEFAVLLPQVVSRPDLIAAVRRHILGLLAPVPWNGNLVPIGISAGLAFVPEQAVSDPQDLYIAADRALYTAKKLPETLLVCA